MALPPTAGQKPAAATSPAQYIDAAIGFVSHFFSRAYSTSPHTSPAIGKRGSLPRCRNDFRHWRAGRGSSAGCLGHREVFFLQEKCYIQLSMDRIGKLGAGNAYGTNTGNLFLELEPAGNGLTGTLRFLDSVFGLVIYEISGKFEAGTLDLAGKPAQVSPGSAHGDITAKATLTPEGHLRGLWTSSLGTAGTFVLYPHDLADPQRSETQTSAVPEQLHSASRNLGAVRLYADDVRALARFVRKDFSVGRAIVTYAARGNEITRYMEDFEKDSSDLGDLRYFKLFISELEAHGLNRQVTVELNAAGSNQIRVQGVHESWVIGKTEAIARELFRYEKHLVTTYKKFGLGINQIFFLAMLVFIPEITAVWQRGIFVAVGLVLLSFLWWTHAKLVPSTVLYMGPRTPSVLTRAWPTILSWSITASASLAAAYAFYLLTRGAAP
jgi:hypothetical protein